jgi:hypothetical protein
VLNETSFSLQELIRKVFEECGYIASQALSKENNMEEYKSFINEVNRKLDKHIKDLEKKKSSEREKDVIETLILYIHHLAFNLNEIPYIKDDEYEFMVKPEIIKFVKVLKKLDENFIHKLIDNVNKLGPVNALREIIGRNLFLKMYITEEINYRDAENIVDKIFKWLPYFNKHEIVKKYKIECESTSIDETLRKLAQYLDTNGIIVLISSKDFHKPAFNENWEKTQVLCPGYSLPDKNIAFSVYVDNDTTAKIAIHEIAHLLGLDHCKIERCIMHVEYKETKERSEMEKMLKEIYGRKTTFCPECDRRLEFLNNLRYQT